MNISNFAELAVPFKEKLAEIKKSLKPDTFWYQYSTLNNFYLLDQLLTGDNRNLGSVLSSGPVADIGAADGDLTFFLQNLGYESEIIENPPTNQNFLQGARLLSEHFGYGTSIHEIDLDSQFNLIKKYGLVFFLGILYHLKNPFYALEKLALSSRYAFVSTKIARFVGPEGPEIQNYQLAYLLDSDECNNDPTNFWVFSDSGLKMLFKRTGWTIRDYKIMGDAESEPASMQKDARAFCFLESERFSERSE
jgi:tRNA (mo5U34)-methyltransferase